MPRGTLINGRTGHTYRHPRAMVTRLASVHPLPRFTKPTPRGEGIDCLGGLVVHVGQAALAAVDAVEVGGHEDTLAARGLGALLTQALHLARVIHLVKLEHPELDLLVLVLVLLGLGVRLLLPLLTATAQAEHQVEGGLLLDVVVREGAAVLQLLTGKDQALLIRGDSLLVLNLGLHIVDSVGRLHLEGDSLAREGLNENLHGCRSCEGFVLRGAQQCRCSAVLTPR
mmetsp:Transcript_11343/g.20497  ORF Transcript_11343/g.20497 Transcript_11343/m.20497 type:complete len:227 (-) Transcript_11343:61-741(-)